MIALIYRTNSNNDHDKNHDNNHDNVTVIMIIKEVML